MIRAVLLITLLMLIMLTMSCDFHPYYPYGICRAPVFTPSSGPQTHIPFGIAYQDCVPVRIECPDPAYGAWIYFRINDGSLTSFSSGSTVYVYIHNTSTTVKAWASCEGYGRSKTSSVTYTDDGVN